jgi:hypothetical protein
MLIQTSMLTDYKKHYFFPVTTALHDDPGKPVNTEPTSPEYVIAVPEMTTTDLTLDTL